MTSLASGIRLGGKLVVEGRLASGGMAEIYVARMELARGLSRRVALKRILPHLTDDGEFLSMFLDEVRLASQLSHPGLVPIVDALEHDGELLVALELVPGWDLSELLRKARELGRAMPPAAVDHVIRQLLAVLDYVHGATSNNGTPLHIVHRDVTPSNVLVAEDGTVRLLDFGVAKAAERLTRTGTLALKGKVSYMSPEQARALPVDHRTDLYAAGLVLFELWSGERAIQGKSEIERLERARAPELPPLGASREAPAALAELCLSLTAIDPDARPSSGADAIARLGPALEGGGASLRGWVLELMGSASRPWKQLPSSLAGAFEAALGDLGHATTQKKGAPKVAPATASSIPGPRESVPPTAGRGYRSVLTPQSGDAVEIDLELDTVSDVLPARVSITPEAPTHTTSRDLAPLGATTAPERSGRRWAALAALAMLVVGVVLYFAIPTGERIDRASRSATSPADAGAVSSPAFVRVTSEPPGAVIVLEGADTGERTPAVLEVAGAAHEVRLALTLDDHVTETVGAQTEPGRTVHVHAELPRLPGTLVVRSSPEQAEVWLDDSPAGRTPLTLEGLARTTHEVRVSAPGRGTERRRVDLDAEARVELDVTLSARVERGELWVNSDVLRATLSVDGREVTRSLPWRGRVTAGERRLTLRDPATGRVQNRTVTVPADGVERVGVFFGR
jgi:serine/threonine-protein kinase